MNVLRLLFVFLGLALSVEASSFIFTGIREFHGLNNSGNVPFDPGTVMTITMAAGSPDVVLTFDPPPKFGNGSSWGLQSVAVRWMMPYSMSYYGDCNHRWVRGENKHCEGSKVATYLGNGKVEIKVSREWFFETAKALYDIKQRYETCTDTGGATDILFPNQRCPDKVDSNIYFSSPSEAVSPPLNAFILVLQWGYSRSASFVFLADNESIRHWACQGHIPPESCPAEEQYGELERIYEWVETVIGEPEREPEETDPEKECYCEEK